ncbi:hypothetical protein BCV72DRAFT_207005, partial [Rhizopus microsporus var. microsporus]
LIPSSYLNEHLLHYQLYPLVIEPVEEVSSETKFGASRETTSESLILCKSKTLRLCRWLQKDCALRMI